MMGRLGSSMQSNPQGWGAGLGALGFGLGSKFSDYENPAESAMPFYNKIPGTIKPYYQPYIDQSTNSLPQLNNQFSRMINNPNDILNTIGAGYQTSPGFDFRKNQSLQAMKQAQQAGGMLGSPQHEQMAGELAGNMAGEDFNNYLSRALGLFTGGLSGLGGLEEQGFGASTGLGQDLASLLAQQGALQFEGTNEENQKEQTENGMIGAGIANLLPMFLSSMF